ncbi:MAG TPA: phosphatase PAP2 family protein [Streptosporangiaceae bacterium]|nr:phosphatase PAP2 family protein [Streptosporangiaceae bacterium]
MRRYLLVALWPAGLAAIAAATVIAARRSPASPDTASDGPPPEPRGAQSLAAVTADQGSPGGQVESATARQDSLSRDLLGLIKLAAIGSGGGVASYRIMASLGPPVVNHCLAIDEPIFRWTESHQVDWWAAVLRRLNTVGNVWTTWGGVGAAAACLGVSWPKQRWLPPSALGLALLVDHYATHRLHRTISRLGPPTNPLGTYPAGGPDRVVLFSGLIAYLLWREFSGSRRGKICATGAVAALAFSQAYSRGYLSQHWFVDILCGLLYGTLLLGPFIAAVRLVAGPAGVQAAPRRALPAPVTSAAGAHGRADGPLLAQ